MDVPKVVRNEYQLVSHDAHTSFFFFFSVRFILLQVNIDDGFLNLMTNDGNAKDDVKIPEGDIGAQIAAAFEEGKDLLVTIVSSMNEEQVCPPHLAPPFPLLIGLVLSQAISFKEAPKGT